MSTNFRLLILMSVLISGSVFCSIPVLAQSVRPVVGQRVGTIETEQLSKLVLERMSALEKSESEGQVPPPAKFVLVDVRSNREMSVSIILGTISQNDFHRNTERYQGLVVMPHCTIGGRCEEFWRRLAEEGWTITSYRGSIVQWVDSELPLVTLKGERTNRFHTNGGCFDLPAKYQQVTI
ncbi:MAG: rhodanese-like domain-containing protein [Pirellulaceae bacterium]|nr:rhodanese-like domain-containing protein [Pirellulaceae bacterium]